MTINPIAARAVAGSGHRSKKTEAFNNLRPIIIEALNGGASVRSLYRELKKDGHDIGCLTWFRKLVGGVDLATDVREARPSAATVPVVAVAPPLEAPRSFGDTRFASDY